MDESQELLTTIESTPAPADFVASVMEKVRKEPKYARLQPVSIELKILWAVSAVMMAIAVLVHLEPPWFVNVVGSFPSVGAVQGFFVNIGNQITGTAGQFLQSLQNIELQESSYMSLWAMVFVLVISVLLFVLHREEVDDKSKDGIKV
jgi:membrane protein YdbS with pleckstrin-like domain